MTGNVAPIVNHLYYISRITLPTYWICPPQEWEKKEITNRFLSNLFMITDPFTYFLFWKGNLKQAINIAYWSTVLTIEKTNRRSIDKQTFKLRNPCGEGSVTQGATMSSGISEDSWETLFGRETKVMQETRTQYLHERETKVRREERDTTGQKSGAVFSQRHSWQSETEPGSETWWGEKSFNICIQWLKSL